MKATQINKEEIKSLNFYSRDVVNDKQSVKQRLKKLFLAMQAGNSFKHKVKIYFQDVFGYKYVETTVWYASESHVMLKGGVLLPVKSIVDVEL